MYCSDGDSTRTRFVAFSDGGDQNDAIRSFNGLFSLFCSTSRRIWDLRRAKAAARRAGHYGSIWFFKRRTSKVLSGPWREVVASTKET